MHSLGRLCIVLLPYLVCSLFFRAAQTVLAWTHRQRARFVSSRRYLSVSTQLASHTNWKISRFGGFQLGWGSLMVPWGWGMNVNGYIAQTACCAFQAKSKLSYHSSRYWQRERVCTTVVRNQNPCQVRVHARIWRCAELRLFDNWAETHSEWRTKPENFKPLRKFSLVTHVMRGFNCLLIIRNL